MGPADIRGVAKEENAYDDQVQEVSQAIPVTALHSDTSVDELCRARKQREV
jgi:hypothetical protein